MTNPTTDIDTDAHQADLAPEIAEIEANGVTLYKEMARIAKERDNLRTQLDEANARADVWEVAGREQAVKHGKELGELRADNARLSEALNEAMDWDWQQPDMPETVIEQCKSALRDAGKGDGS